ncbi:MAG: hypothetical protein IBJ00_02150 [Alphaproteobacteria bacterium]|nr:hypothetical protein [Alphaproteobacteria bacterium]
MTIGFSFVYLSPYPLLLFLNIVAWSFVLDRKNFLSQIKGQILHSHWYILEGIKFIEERWEWIKLLQLLLAFDLRQAWQLIMFHNPVTRGIILNLPFFLLLAQINNIASFDSLEYFSLVIISISVFLWSLTQFSIFRAFGEPERYLEFSIPAFFYLFYSLPFSNTLKAFALFYSLAFYAYNLYLMNKAKTFKTYQSITEAQSLLKSENVKNLLCATNNETYLFAEKHNILVGFFINNIYSDFYHFFYEKYPDVNPNNLKELCSRYKVSHILINKLRKISVKYDTSFGKTIFENDIYKIIRVK